MSDCSNHYIFGLHSVEALLKKSPKEIQQIFLLKGRKDKRLQHIHMLSEQQHLSIQWFTREKLDALVAGNHQGVVVQVSSTKIEVYDEAYLQKQFASLLDNSVIPFLLILDGVTDPHNLGACLRSAEAAGVQAVIVPKDNSASLTPTVIKVACGAAEIIPLIRVTNLSRTMQWLQQQGVWILGAAGEAEQYHDQVDMTGSLAIAMGSEGKGLRRLTRERCDGLMAIPMAGTVSSLNVSVATGICLFEAVRQRQ